MSTDTGSNGTPKPTGRKTATSLAPSRHCLDNGDFFYFLISIEESCFTDDREIAGTKNDPYYLMHGGTSVFYVVRGRELSELLLRLFTKNHVQKYEESGDMRVRIKFTMRPASALDPDERVLYEAALEDVREIVSKGKTDPAYPLSAGSLFLQAEKWLARATRMHEEVGQLNASTRAGSSPGTTPDSGPAGKVVAHNSAQKETVGANTRANTGKKKVLRIPKNPEVIRLMQALDSNNGDGVSQNAVAFDFTGGDEQKAKSLMAQVRRFRRKQRQA